MIDKVIDIIGVRLDKGAGTRGADKGAGAIRSAGLLEAVKGLGYTVCDRGDITADLCREECRDGRLNNLDTVNEINTKLYNRLSESLEAGRFTVVLGGDHSLAAGSVTAVQRHFKNMGIIWVDAHGDFNNAQSTPSGNIHGMPLSAVTGGGPDEILPFREKGTAFVNPRNTVIIGGRAFDQEEARRIKSAGVTVFTVDDIKKEGIAAAAQKAVRTASCGTQGFYLSLDLDALDPSDAPGVGTPSDGGLSYNDARLLCRRLAGSGALLGIEIVELNPIFDDSNRTGHVAVGLITALLDGGAE